MSRRQRRRSRPPPPGRSRLQRRRLLTHSYLRHHLKHRRRAATVMYAERAGFGTRLPPRCQAHARAQCGRWPNVVTTHARPGCIATTRCRVQAKAPAGRVPGRNQTVQSQPMATGPLLSSWHLLTHVHASHVCPPPRPGHDPPNTSSHPSVHLALQPRNLEHLGSKQAGMRRPQALGRAPRAWRERTQAQRSVRIGPTPCPRAGPRPRDLTVGKALVDRMRGPGSKNAQARSASPLAIRSPPICTWAVSTRRCVRPRF